MFAQKIRVDWLAETLARELNFLNHLSRKAIWSQEQPGELAYANKITNETMSNS
jgi:hypothetical protein